MLSEVLTSNSLTSENVTLTLSGANRIVTSEPDERY